MEIRIPFSGREIPVSVPEGTEVLRAAGVEALNDAAASISAALEHPIGCRPFDTIAREKAAPDARACIVVSDHTRPVPYRGKDGILLPLIHRLLQAGFKPENICVLIALGTHAMMSEAEITAMLGSEPAEAGIEILCHDCQNKAALGYVGTTSRGTEAYINRRYLEADFKILTGLVESHFMAGASGGRKSVCPGIFGETGTFVFHGPALMGDGNSRDLLLAGNPVHEESLAVAKLAGVDFILNVTLDGTFRITGVFAGELEAAHAAAVEKLKSYVGIPFEKEYDLVITHAGFVGRNHYQAAKAGVEASYAVRKGGAVILAADNHDPNPIGSDRYLTLCALLRQIGAEPFERLIRSEDWVFLPDQWQVQMWARLLRKIAPDNLFYFAPQLTDADWRCLPGRDGRGLLGDTPADNPDALRVFVEAAIAACLAESGVDESAVARGEFRIAYLADGPYAVPLKVEE